MSSCVVFLCVVWQTVTSSVVFLFVVWQIVSSSVVFLCVVWQTVTICAWCVQHLFECWALQRLQGRPGRAAVQAGHHAARRGAGRRAVQHCTGAPCTAGPTHQTPARLAP